MEESGGGGGGSNLWIRFGEETQIPFLISKRLDLYENKNSLCMSTMISVTDKTKIARGREEGIDGRTLLHSRL